MALVSPYCLIFNWTMQSFFTGCSVPASPGAPRAGVAASSAPSPTPLRSLRVLLRLHFLLLLCRGVRSSVNSEPGSLYSRGAAFGCAHLPCVPAPLRSCLSWCSSSTSRSGSGSCRCSQTGTWSNPDFPGRVGFAVKVWITGSWEGLGWERAGRSLLLREHRADAQAPLEGCAKSQLQIFNYKNLR